MLKKILPALALAGLLVGCTQSNLANTSGMKAIEVDPSTRGPVSGVGIEARDIQAMTDQMIRDLLTVPQIANAATPPQIIVDAAFFKNESSQRLNTNMIADRMRTGLLRAAQGRIVFVSRESSGVVAIERDLMEQGLVDVATTGRTRAQAGADYRLIGRITSQQATDMNSGTKQRYSMINFEMIDLQRSTIIWSNIYEFERAAADDVIYR